MNTFLSQASQQGAPATLPVSCDTRISNGLILVYISIQVADILLMIVASGRGYFRLGAGPIGHLLGLNQLGVWLIMKTSAFVVLITAVLAGRRRLLLCLNFSLAALLTWTLAMLSIL